MGASPYDVVIVGGGCAGLSAAIGLAKAGFGAVVLEAAPFPGAENWSGCVYFCENLVHPSLLGPQGLEGLAWERRLVERGFFLSNGHNLLGMTYRDPQAFRHCYTVLRPIFDHHLAQLAAQNGVVLLNSTTAESLIRDGDRIIGVTTNRGPVYADLTFLAEGDASHLVTREGYERSRDPQQAPKFLHGIKQVIDLPPGAVEENFGLKNDEGAAYEVVLRNGTLKGKPVHLNMGGFLYTNRQSVSIGLVLPADHLGQHFDGEPNLLVEWFESLPDVRRWCRGGTRGVFGAKLIRGGGAKDMPHLINHGLAIGGAATAIGVDFPYPNYTGPATRMGLLLVEAAKAIRSEGGGYTQDQLRRHYLEPLQATRYWRDVEFLRRWPGYVERTQVFFGRNVDLTLSTIYCWTRPWSWWRSRWLGWVRLLIHLAGPGHWPELKYDFDLLSRALRLKEITGRPAPGRLLLKGWVNSLRDLCGQPRAGLPPAGELRLLHAVDGSLEAGGRPPWIVRRWLRRFTPVLAAAARRVYTNNDEPLGDKLRAAIHLLLEQINILDVLLAAIVMVFLLTTAGLLIGWRSLLQLLGRRQRAAPARGLACDFLTAASRAGDLTPLLPLASQNWEGRLGGLSYQPPGRSHIHVLWPQQLDRRQELAKDALWHVCPAHVYEARPGPLGQLQVIVNFENCIKCETCWRTTGAVDWGRDGQHRFIYAVHSPALQALLPAVEEAGDARPIAPRALSWWAPAAAALREPLESRTPSGSNGRTWSAVRQLGRLVEKLDGKLSEFAEALKEEPRTIDGARSQHLCNVAGYAERLAEELVALLRQLHADRDSVFDSELSKCLLDLGHQLVAKLGSMLRHAAQGHFAWADADGRHVQQHHLEGLRQLLPALGAGTASREPEPLDCWLAADRAEQEFGAAIAQLRHRLDEAFPPGSWRVLEPEGTRHDGPPPKLSALQDDLLLELAEQTPPADLSSHLHHPLRKALLAELGRRDPSLAYRVAVHFWARDLVQRGESRTWQAFGVVDGARIENGRCFGQVLFIPAADRTVLLVQDHLLELPRNAPGSSREWLAPLGLRGAGLQRIVLNGMPLPPQAQRVDPDKLIRTWETLSSADLISIATGMADLLTERCISHATSRVQFPGLFGDDEARDTIGKFGAVKKMIAEMAARRYLLKTIDHALTPVDFSTASAARSALLKALAAEALGTAPGSISYNAGQVFGGTGYSEEDIFAKYYRDAAAFRFLGPRNPDVWRRHGRSLLADWQADGRGLAVLPCEAELFDEVAQRKALQAELDQLRIWRSRLRAVVNRTTKSTLSEADQAGFTNALARQDALQLAGKALLLRTHARLEDGHPSETDVALLQSWFDELSSAMLEFEESARRCQAPSRADAARPSLGVDASEPPPQYADFLAASLPYDSGGFLLAPIDFSQPRLVPELVSADAELRDRDCEYREALTAHFGAGRNGQLYERYVEARHRPDPDDLDFLRRTGYFRFPIPKEFGGGAQSKAEYYLMIQNAQRLADVSISLTVQVNTSIGTTPILLAFQKDLPKARKELAPFVADDAWQKEIEERLQSLLLLPSIGQLATPMEALQQRMEETVLSRTALRVLAHRALEAWSAALRGLKAYDFTTCQAALKKALDGWRHACVTAHELLDELSRRSEACGFYLRLIAAGEISAFALTEPSAGSDTARVASRAKPRSVPVDVDSEGVLTFTPWDGHESRVLLDARRVEVRPEGMFYRWSPTAEPSRIVADDYNYETDDPQRQRWYLHGQRKVHFSDIAQLRERGGKLWYDYWELNGAKMWITNGRVMGVTTLYARTEEGVTGFMVDRHAEGFIVGKDERKLGQCGSPTNELALQLVRVPRENVLGLEGRGQVNALETLNVGRTGIAMSSVASLQTVLAACEALSTNKSPLEHAARFQRMTENRFIAEALAFEVVGRFEHPQTKSVRMESAIAKTLVTELLHETIELAEDVHGPAGQTQQHLIEKRKRDARVLNIYEGTNEIQRSLIWRDLVSEIAPRCKPDAAAVSQTETSDPRDAADEYAALREELGKRLRDAVLSFGANLWQNPSFQASCFVLAEVAAWLKAMDSTVGRLNWLVRYGKGDVTDAERAVGRCAGEVRWRLAFFDQQLQRLKQGIYAPGIRAAALLFREQAAKPAAPTPLCHEIGKPLSVLVILELTAAAVPRPLVVDGDLLEPHWTLTEATQAALETALRLRDQAGPRVSIRAAAVGPRAVLPKLREVMALEVNSTLMIISPRPSLFPDQAAAALARVLRRRGERYDLILGPAGDGRYDEGLLTPLAAAALEMPCEADCSTLVVRHVAEVSSVLIGEADGKRGRVRPLPLAMSVPAGVPLRPFTVAGYLRAISERIEVEPWPRGQEADTVHWLLPTQTAASQAELPPQTLTAPRAADLFLDELGMHGDRRSAEPLAEGVIRDVDWPRLLDGCRSLAIVAADREGRLGEGAPAVAQAALGANQPAGVLLLAPEASVSQRLAAGQLADMGAQRVAILVYPEATAAAPGLLGRLVSEALPLLERPPLLVIGQSWLEATLPSLQRKWQRPGQLAARVRRLSFNGPQLVLEYARRQGRVLVQRTLACAPAATHWLSLVREAEVQAPNFPAPQPGNLLVERWSPRLERLFGQQEMQRLLAELKEEAGVQSLSEAEFIIDVGFGIGNRDGYDEVVLPLERALRELGIANVAIGGSRKVTEELHVLPVDRQIGQSGVSVNPRILLAIGISGAPQHLSYIGQRATIIAFNRDAEAPLMTLNRRQPRPRVFGVVGDLFVTVPAFVAALRRENLGPPRATEHEAALSMASP